MEVKRFEETTENKKVGIPEIGIPLETLPSRGVSYPSDIAIKYRPYTWGEVKAMSGSKNISYKDRIDLVMNGIIIDHPTFNKYDLTLNDVTYLAIIRHQSSLGNDSFRIEYYNPYKKVRDIHNFKISDIEIKFIDERVIKAPFEVKFSDKSYLFGPLTVNNVLTLVRKNYLSEDEGFDASALMAAMVRFGDDRAEGIEDIKNYFSSLVGEDGEVLDEVSGILHHGMLPLKINCEDANGNSKVVSLGLEGRQSLIVPFRDDQNIIGNRICFGSK